MKSSVRTLLTLSAVLGACLDNKKESTPEHVAVCLVCGKTTKPKGCSLAAHLIVKGWKNGCCPDCQKV